MTNPSPYVARKPLRFGDRTLQPGESVPVEPGRDYRLMLRLGQIIEIPQAAAVAQATQAAPFPKDSTVFFVGEDGAYSLATFHLLQEAPEDVRLDLELPPGAQVALVTFADDQESTFVLPDSLLPEQPTQRLIDDLSGREDSEPAQPTEPLPLGYAVLWVNEDGSHQQVTFEGMALAAEMQRLVTFDGPEAEFERAGLSGPSVLLARVQNAELGVQQVSLLDLLPGEAAQRLLAFEQRMAAEGKPETGELEPLQARVAFLERLLQAVRSTGDTIPSDFPAADFLAQNGVTTLAGLRLLADGKNGRANLMALEAIGGGRADKILAALASPPAPEG